MARVHKSAWYGHPSYGRPADTDGRRGEACSPADGRTNGCRTHVGDPHSRTALLATTDGRSGEDRRMRTAGVARAGGTEDRTVQSRRADRAQHRGAHLGHPEYGRHRPPGDVGSTELRTARCRGLHNGMQTCAVLCTRVHPTADARTAARANLANCRPHLALLAAEVCTHACANSCT